MNQRDLILRFKKYLQESGLSQLSIKNYLSDIRQFLKWGKVVSQRKKIQDTQYSLLSSNLFSTYRSHLLDTKMPRSTVNRKLSSLRRFGQFLKKEKILKENPAQGISNLPQKEIPRILNNFAHFLNKERLSSVSIKNYLADISRFLNWVKKTTQWQLSDLPAESITQVLLEYKKRLTQFSSLSPRTINRQLSSLRKFADWAQKTNLIARNPFKEPTAKEKLKAISKKIWAPFKVSLKGLPLYKKIAYHLRYTRPSWYRKYNELEVAHYFHWAILIIFCSALGFGIYNQIIRQAQPAPAYPTALTRPKRYLSFQGRLTDSSGNPITSATDFVFKLYDASTGGNKLWDSGTCSITPDQDGIFNTILGSTCGSELTSDVFSENAEVWLEVTVAGETLSPRQQIATVAYALNAETLQGYPASASAVENTIPVINNSGDLVIGNFSPKIQSTSGTFAIEGQALSLATTTGSNGNITLESDNNITLETKDSGVLDIKLSGSSGNQMRVTDSNITSGALVSVGTDSTGFDLLNLSSGSSETSVFSVDESGNTSIGGDAYITGNLGVGTTDPDSKLHVVGGDVYIAPDSGYTFNNASANEDLYVYGNLEVDGTIYGDGSGITGISASPGGSDGQVQYNNGGVMGGATNLFYDDTNNLVGIGTNSPTSLLHVSGAVTGKALVIFDETGDQAIFTASASGTPKFTIANNGDLTATGKITGLTGITSSGTITFSGLSDGLVKASSGVLSGGNSVDLSSEVTGVLPLANGGTNKNITAENGAIVYSDADSFELLSPGTSGYVLQTNGAGAAPSWVDISSSGGPWTLSGTALYPDSASSNVLIGSTTTGDAVHKLLVTGTNTGKALVVFNETGTNNIFEASASGVQKFAIDTSGNVDIAGSYKINGTSVLSSNTLGSGVVNSSLTSVGTLTTGTWNADTITTDYGGTGLTSYTAGDLIYYSSGTAFSKLAIGSANQVLVSNGSAPTWNTIGSSSITDDSLDWADFTDSMTLDNTTTIDMDTNSADLNFDSGTLFIDSSANRVGIGTTSPGAKLDVAGNILLDRKIYATRTGTGDTDGRLDIAANTASTDGGMLTLYGPNYTGREGDIDLVSYGLTSGEIKFTNYDGSTWNRLITIKPSGNVGIGTISPTSLLHLSGAVTGKALVVFDETGDQDIFTASASGTPRFRIAHNGDVIIGPSGTFNNASASEDLYVKGNIEADGTIYGTFEGTITPSGFTQGSVIFAGSGGTLTEDNANFYWDDANNRLGIGTTGPGYALEVAGTLGVSGVSTFTNRVDIQHNIKLIGDADRSIFLSDEGVTSDLNIDNNAGGAINFNKGEVYFENGGNVGIGTTSPEKKLHVSGGNILLDNNKYFYWKDSGGTARGLLHMDSSDVFTIHNYTGDISIDTNTTSRIYLKNSGNVGIGTTAPSNFKLQVAGNVGPETDSSYDLGSNTIRWANVYADDVYATTFHGEISGTVPFSEITSGTNTQAAMVVGTGASLKFNDDVKLYLGTGSDGEIYSSSDNLYIANVTQDKDIYFQVNDGGSTTTPLFIDGSTSRVGIGTTDPSTKLQVAGHITISDGYGLGRQIGSSTDEYIYYAYRTGIQSLSGLGSQAPWDFGMSLESDAAIYLVETDSDKLSGWFNVNDNEFIWNGNVGIGTTGPSSKLQIGTGTISQDWSDTTYAQVLIAGVDNEAEVMALKIQDENLNEYFRVSSTGAGDSDKGKVYIAGNVGIGTTGPISKLHVSGAVTGKALVIFDETGDQYIFTASASGTPKFVIDNSGQVGIGTSNPSKPLHVFSSTANTVIYLQSSKTDSNAGFNLQNDARQWQMLIRGDVGDKLIVRDNTASADRLTIDASGLVGIGTTSPNYKLEVSGGDIYTSGDLRIAGDDLFMATNTANYFLMADGTNYNPVSPATARTGLGLDSGGAGDIWVDEAGDTMSGTLNMNNNLITNIGNAGTDFTATGGLVLAGDLQLSNNQILNSSGMATIVLSATPSTTWNALDAGAWKISNTGNVGQAALAVDQTKDGDIFTASASGTPKFVIDNSGKVGIGTTTPGADLNVAGSVLIGGTTQEEMINVLEVQKSGWGGIGVIGNNTADIFYMLKQNSQFAYVFMDQSESNALTLESPTHLKFNAGGSSEQMRITSDGKVGIGTTSPGTTLDVRGNAYFGTNDSSAATLAIYGNGTGSAEGGQINLYMAADHDTTYDQWSIDVYQDDLRFFRGSSEAVRIKAEGKVGIGTNNPSTYLQIAGDGVGDYDSPDLQIGGTEGNIRIGAQDTDSGFQIYTNSAYPHQLVLQTEVNPDAADYEMLSVRSSGYAERFSVIHGVAGYASQFYDSLAVGVAGDNSPTVTHVDLGTGTGGDLFVKDDTEIDGQIYVNGTGDNYFAGNVGIGTASPANPLHVYGSDETYIKVQTSAQDTRAGYHLKAGSDANSDWQMYTDTTYDSVKWRNVGRANIIMTLQPYGNLYIDGTYYGAGGVNSGSANDLAEHYNSLSSLDHGDIIVADSQNPIYIQPSTTAYQTSLLGIISTKPAVTMGTQVDIETLQGDTTGGQTEDTRPKLALAGRVPAKVTTANGEIRIGDPITSSFLERFGMKATKAGPIVGKALESTNNWSEQTCPTINSLDEISWPEDDGNNPAKPCFRLPDGTYVGKIMVFVNVSWYDPDAFLTDTGELQLTSSRVNGLTNYELKDKNNNIIDRIGAFAELMVAKIKAGLVETKILTAEDKIISPIVETEEIQFKNQNPKIKITEQKAKLTIENHQGKPVMEIKDDKTVSHFGDLIIRDSNFTIQDSSGSAVASIDKTGNASFSGNLEVGQDATIAGTLHAQKIVAEEIVGLESKFGNLIAATVSAQHITQNITNITQVIEASASSSSTTNPEQPTPTPSIEMNKESTQSAEIEDWEIEKLINEILNTSLEATPQAELGITGSEELRITNNLTVLGTSSLADTTIAGSLNVGATLAIADNSINSLTGPLYLNSLGLGGLNILAGKITINQHGDMTIEGNLTVKGVLAVNQLSPLPEKDLVIDLEEKPSKFGKLLVKGVDNQVVASIDASGSAQFKQIAAEKIIIANNNPPALPETNNTTTTNATAGEAILSAGETEVMIQSSLITDKSLIYITPLSDTQNKVLYVKAKKAASDEEPGWFKVDIDQAINQDIKFNWWIIN